MPYAITAKSPRVTQVIFPHEANLKKLTGSNGDLEEMCNDPKVKDAALKELNATGKKQGFKALEVLLLHSMRTLRILLITVRW